MGPFLRVPCEFRLVDFKKGRVEYVWRLSLWLANFNQPSQATILALQGICLLETPFCSEGNLSLFNLDYAEGDTLPIKHVKAPSVHQSVMLPEFQKHTPPSKLITDRSSLLHRWCVRVSIWLDDVATRLQQLADEALATRACAGSPQASLSADKRRPVQTTRTRTLYLGKDRRHLQNPSHTLPVPQP